MICARASPAHRQEWQITDAGVCHGDVLYIPAGETSGEPVRQASSFMDENDQFSFD